MSDAITKSDLDRAREKARLINAYHRTFNTTDGQLVLEDFRRAFGTESPAFIPGPNGFDPYRAAQRDGQRQVVIHVETILKTTTPDGDGNVEKSAVTIITETQEN
jgi:hypothetical protein